jgi:hypothetical protein
MVDCELFANIRRLGDHIMADDDHWTYAEWENNTVEKIVTNGLSAPEEDRADYLRVQIKLAVQQALRHGQSGRSEDEPVVE